MIRTLMIALVVASATHGATPVHVSDLDAEPDRWNGRVVTIRGEVVGDYSVRPDHTWIQVNDDPYVDAPVTEGGPLEGGNAGIGVRLDAATSVETWGPPGGSEHRGPVIEVTGVFLYNDASSAGDTFVEASDVRLLEGARPLAKRLPNAVAVVTGLAFVLIGATIFAVTRRRRLNPSGTIDPAPTPRGRHDG